MTIFVYKGSVGGPGPSPTPSNPVGTYVCAPGNAVLDAVYLTSANTVDLADADDSLKQPLIGIIIQKISATSAVIQYYGEVDGFSGLTPGATYYLSQTPGQITATAPMVPGAIVQRVGYAKDADTLVVQIDRDFEEIQP